MEPVRPRTPSARYSSDRCDRTYQPAEPYSLLPEAIAMYHGPWMLHLSGLSPASSEDRTEPVTRPKPVQPSSNASVNFKLSTGRNLARLTSYNTKELAASPSLFHTRGVQTSQNNAIVERRFRTVFAAARASPSSSNLPSRYWT